MQSKQAYFPDPQNTDSPYSPAIAVGDQVYIAGQGPISPQTNKVAGATFEEQLELTLDNVDRALRAANCSLSDCVKITVYLSDMANYDKLNVIYRQRFSKPLPARTTIQAVLWHHIQIEIDAIAIRGCGERRA